MPGSGAACQTLAVGKCCAAHLSHVVCALFFILYSTVWGVEPVVTHQTSWLESTGVCGVRQSVVCEKDDWSQFL